MKDKIYPRFFSAADLGKSFREVAVDVIKTESQDIVNRWYHSAKDADLFVWFDADQNIIKQQLSFYGQIIEWNVIEGVKTGCVLESESEGEVKSKRASDVVKFDVSPQASSLQQALDLLNHITVLKDSERQNLIVNFTDSRQTAAKMDPEEFVRRFGRAVAQTSRRQASRWSRFWLWLKQGLS